MDLSEQQNSSTSSSPALDLAYKGFLDGLGEAIKCICRPGMKEEAEQESEDRHPMLQASVRARFPCLREASTEAISDSWSCSTKSFPSSPALSSPTVVDAISDSWSCSTKSFPSSPALSSPTVVDALLQENKRLVSLLACFLPAPRAAPAPRGVKQKVLQVVLELCWEYAQNGIEGVRKGHIFVVGPPEEILTQGDVRGTNLMDNANISIFSHTYDIKMEMNFDGAHVVDGESGLVRAHKFFSEKISRTSSTGGSGHAAAAALSQGRDVVSFKVSEDGGIKEFRAGALFAEHR